MVYVRMNSMKQIVAAALLALTMPTPSPAGETQTAFGFFYDQCLASGPNFDRTAALAKDKNWTPLAADMALTFSPMENPVALEGWIFSDDDFQAVVVSKATVAEKAVEGCTVAISEVDADTFVKALSDRLKPDVVGEEPGQDRVHKLYTARVGGRAEAITLTLPMYPKGSDQVIASAVAEQQVEN
jgi:hypothetical protein